MDTTHQLLSPDIVEILNFGPYFLSLREELPLNLTSQQIIMTMQNRGYYIPRCLQQYLFALNYYVQEVPKT